MNFPAYKKVSVGGLIPYARNARTHSEEQVAQIAASIREFGFLNPVIVDGDNGLIAGHGRVLAARKLGLEELPAIEASALSEAQRRAYVLADNKLALNAGWDIDLLKVELSDLQAIDFDLSLTGFSGLELADLFVEQTDGLTEPDAIPALQDVAITAPGDVWVMGAHRVLCGDSTSVDALDRLMNGERGDLLFTSPPYGQQRDYGAAKEKVQEWDILMQGVFSVAPVKDGAQVLVNLGLIHRDNEWIPYWDAWVEWMRSSGWRRFGWYVWDQGFGLAGDWKGRLAPSHEFIFHFNREAKKVNKIKDKNPENIGARKGRASTMREKDGKLKKFSNPEASSCATKIPDSVIRITRQVGRIGDGLDHPAVFPVELAEEMIGAYSREGDVVFEPFCGSGTQVIAAEKTGRHCYGMELDPVYCDVAVRRWQDFTGKAATLESDGRSFDEIAAGR